MGMPALSEPMYWTADLVRELPDDGNRYECIDGELLVTPSPGNPHQAVVGELHLVVAPYVRAMGIGYTQVSPLDVELDEGMLVQPDLLAFRVTPESAKGRIKGPDLFLAVEVVSKSTARRDRLIKRAFYARIGVQEYWIVDQAARTVERWRPGAAEAEIIRDTLTWHPTGATHPLAIDLPALFDAIPEPFRTP